MTMTDEPFWEISEKPADSNQEESIESKDAMIDHHASSSRTTEPLSEKFSSPTFRAARSIFFLVFVSFFMWSIALEPLLTDTNTSKYADDAESWPSTIVHPSSEIYVWSEEVSCGEDTCLEDFFTAKLVLNCTLSEDKTYLCGPNVPNGTLFETELACEPNNGFFGSSTAGQNIKRGSMPNPCIALYDIWDWGFGGNDFPVQYSDSRYEEPWEVYDTECKWQSEPNDEPYWNCYFANDEYDTWWHHCEFDGNHSLWFCTDVFGSEASSEDNQNATERPEESAQEVIESFQEDALEVRYDPADPTRVFVGDPTMVSTNVGVYVGIFIAGLAVCVGVVRIITSTMKITEEH